MAKAVEMMKKAIKDSELNGYKWTADKTGLHWNYGADFGIKITKDEAGVPMVKFEDDNTGESVSTFIIPETDAWLMDDTHYFLLTVDEAIYWAARKMISKANYMY